LATIEMRAWLVAYFALHDRWNTLSTREGKPMCEGHHCPSLQTHSLNLTWELEPWGVHNFVGRFPESIDEGDHVTVGVQVAADKAGQILERDMMSAKQPMNLFVKAGERTTLKHVSLVDNEMLLYCKVMKNFSIQVSVQSTCDINTRVTLLTQFTRLRLQENVKDLHLNGERPLVTYFNVDESLANVGEAVLYFDALQKPGDIDVSGIIMPGSGGSCLSWTAAGSGCFNEEDAWLCAFGLHGKFDTLRFTINQSGSVTISKGSTPKLRSGTWMLVLRANKKTADPVAYRVTLTGPPENRQSLVVVILVTAILPVLVVAFFVFLNRLCHTFVLVHQSRDMRELSTFFHDVKMVALSMMCLYSPYRHLVRTRVRKSFTRSSYVAVVNIGAGAFFAAALQFAIQRWGTRYWINGNRDVCYFNFKCYTPMVLDFPINNIVSHIPYFVCGYFVVLYTAIWEQRISKSPGSENAPDLGVFYGIGFALALLGVGSTVYHICPSEVMFQFDAAMMYVIVLLSSISLGDIDGPVPVSPEAFMLFIVVPLWLVSFAGTWLDYQVTDFHVFEGIYITTVAAWACTLVVMAKRIFPGVVHFSRGLLVLRILLVVMFAFMLGDEVFRTQMAGGTSNFLLGITLLVMVVTVTRQVLHHDKYVVSAPEHRMSYKYVRFCIGRAIVQFGALSIFMVICVVGLSYFNARQTDISKSPAQSRDLNSSCGFLGFYDNHDVWHLVSAIAVGIWVLVLLDIRIRIWKHPLSARNPIELEGAAVELPPSMIGSEQPEDAQVIRKGRTF